MYLFQWNLAHRTIQQSRISAAFPSKELAAGRAAVGLVKSLYRCEFLSSPKCALEGLDMFCLLVLKNIPSGGVCGLERKTGRDRQGRTDIRVFEMWSCIHGLLLYNN